MIRDLLAAWGSPSPTEAEDRRNSSCCPAPQCAPGCPRPAGPTESAMRCSRMRDAVRYASTRLLISGWVPRGYFLLELMRNVPGSGAPCIGRSRGCRRVATQPPSLSVANMLCEQVLTQTRAMFRLALQHHSDPFVACWLRDATSLEHCHPAGSGRGRGAVGWWSNDASRALRLMHEAQAVKW